MREHDVRVCCVQIHACVRMYVCVCVCVCVCMCVCMYVCVVPIVSSAWAGIGRAGSDTRVVGTAVFLFSLLFAVHDEEKEIAIE